MSDLGAIHDPRAGMQHKMGLSAAGGRSRECIVIGAGELGLIKRLVVAAVSAEGDDVVIGANVETCQRARQIGREGTAAPGVERVAVAGNEPDLLLDRGPSRGRQRRQLQIGGGTEIEGSARQVRLMR